MKCTLSIAASAAFFGFGGAEAKLYLKATGKAPYSDFLESVEKLPAKIEQKFDSDDDTPFMTISDLMDKADQQ